MVNRATFYRHYLDKYDLLDQYMNEVYELTAAQEPSAQTTHPGPDSSGPPSGLVNMLAHVQHHVAFYRGMLGPNGDLAFLQKIQQYAQQRLRQLVPSESATSSSMPHDFTLACLSYAGTGALIWWLQNIHAYSPEEIAAWIVQLNRATLEHSSHQSSTKS